MSLSFKKIKDITINSYTTYKKKNKYKITKHTCIVIIYDTERRCGN